MYDVCNVLVALNAQILRHSDDAIICIDLLFAFQNYFNVIKTTYLKYKTERKVTKHEKTARHHIHKILTITPIIHIESKRQNVWSTPLQKFSNLYYILFDITIIIHLDIH